MWAVVIAAAMTATECPSADEVLSALNRLRPAPNPAAYSLTVQRAGDALTLTATRPTGEPWLERAIPVAGTCAELAEAGAVVLFAWEVRLAPGDVPAPRVEARAAPVAPPPTPPLRARLAVGLTAWLGATGAIWGGEAGVTLEPRPQWLTLDAEVRGQGVRTTPLGAGAAQWSRVSLALGAGAHVATGAVEWHGSLLAVTGLFFARGVGFDTSHAVVDYDLGSSARGRLYLPGIGKLRPYLALGVTLWLRRHDATTTGDDPATKELPWLEGNGVVGLSVLP